MSLSYMHFPLISIIQTASDYAADNSFHDYQVVERKTSQPMN